MILVSNGWRVVLSRIGTRFFLPARLPDRSKLSVPRASSSLNLANITQLANAMVCHFVTLRCRRQWQWWIWWYVEILNRNPMSNKIISYITLHSLSSPWLGLGSVQAQVTQSQSTNTKSSGRAARYPSVEIERKNTVLGFPIEDEFLVLVNHWRRVASGDSLHFNF